MSVTAFEIAEAPPANAPMALSPANIGISGNIPPDLGIWMTQGALILFLIPFTELKAILTALFTSAELFFLNSD